MFLVAYILALRLSHHRVDDRAIEISEVVTEVVEAHDPALIFPKLGRADPYSAREEIARVVVRWSFGESTWETKAVGDGGKACGLMQPHWRYTVFTCEELKDPRRNLDVALTIIERYVHKCGSLRAALGAYATGGLCGGAPKLVESRCEFGTIC